MPQAGDFKAAVNAAGDYVSEAAQSAKEAVVGKVRSAQDLHNAACPLHVPVQTPAVSLACC